MEEEMMMINRRTTTFHEKHHSNFSTLIPTPTPTPTPSPTWKLYENPSYTGPQTDQNHHQIQRLDQNKQIHLLHLPISTRKIAESFWDLTFIKPLMDSELDTARSQIMELKKQLEYEHKARKKVESVNKKLIKQLLGEKKERESLEQDYEKLAIELTSSKAEISRLKRDMEEERKMLRVAEVLREERVQMKLNEAKIILEEKILELEITKTTHNHNHHHHHHQEDHQEKNDNVISGNSSKLHGRKVSLEVENPHIKHGIRGFVEFPRVVRAIGSRSRHLGSKLECQKAQLMILLKQKTHIQSNNLIMR